MGLDSLQVRLEAAVAAVKASTAARHKNKCKVSDDIREMRQSAGSNVEESAQERARKARMEFDARVGAVPRGKTARTVL